MSCHFSPLMRQATGNRHLPPYSFPLLIPSYRQVLTQLLQAQAVGFVATEDRLDDVRREAGQAEHAADVGAVAADVLGQVFDAGVLAGFELGLPAVPLGDGLDQRPVAPAPL